MAPIKIDKGFSQKVQQKGLAPPIGQPLPSQKTTSKKGAQTWMWAAAAACVATAQGGAVVRAGFSAWDESFVFESVPLPASNDAASSASFRLADGARDGNGGGLDALHDGRVPEGEDRPSENFFFQAGSAGGRILVDLGRAISVGQVNTYSWHAGARGPQVYRLYAADGRAKLLDPKAGVDPAAGGWALLARVDTRPKEGDGGGQHGVSIAAAGGALGPFRYLLFDVQPTETRDAFGHTFFSEIDVIDANGPSPTSGVTVVKRARSVFEAGEGKCRVMIDATDAPDLAEWSERTLKPVIQAWYPRVAELLASDGYRPPAEIQLRYRTDMGGTPAAAAGGGVRLNAGWFRRELEREAAGAVVHELVHVVQDYGRARRSTNAKPRPAPGWVVEGIADYVRWFLYEPQTRGAEITRHNLGAAKYDGSYRISANFLDWATKTYDRELVSKLNAAAREGRYDESLWRVWTGKSAQELGEEWLAAQRKRLGL